MIIEVRLRVVFILGAIWFSESMTRPDVQGVMRRPCPSRITFHWRVRGEGTRTVICFHASHTRSVHDGVGHGSSPLWAGRPGVDMGCAIVPAGTTPGGGIDTPQRVLATTMQAVIKTMRAEAGSILLFDQEGKGLVFEVAAGGGATKLPGCCLQPGQGVAGWVAEHGQSALIPEARRDPRFFDGIDAVTGSTTHSLLCVPLGAQERIIGVIEVLNKAGGEFSRHDLRLLESLAAEVAIAIENARLYEDLQRKMEALKNTQAQLVQSAKLAAIGELAAEVAHELNNPLTCILGFSKLLLKNTTLDDRARCDLTTIVAEAQRARGIVRDLLNFAHQTEAHRKKADLNRAVQDALALTRQYLEKSGVVIEENYDADLPPISLDVNRMKQVFLNLITNAAQAMPQGGTLTITTSRVGSEAFVRISDTGEGIQPEHLDRIFEPFFTTRPVGQGTGLGLSVSLGIVQVHGGRIEVESEIGQGATFTVWLPVDTVEAVQERGNNGW